MFDGVFQFYNQLPWIIQEVAKFWLLIIILRGVIANDITSWLEEKGLIRRGKKGIIYHVLDFFYDTFTSLMHFILPERKLVIWKHFSLGHQDLPCTECQL